MSKKPKPDFTQVAFRIGQRAAHIEPPAEEAEPLSPKAAAGKKGGIKGGAARAERLSADQRSQIAKKAADARWRKS